MPVNTNLPYGLVGTLTLTKVERRVQLANAQQ